jgi:hypothetical protein
VNSVAQLGAAIEILVDGKQVRREVIPDRDGKNDGSAGEINRPFTIRIPAGRRRIEIRNPGADWLTVDRYVFQEALR